MRTTTPERDLRKLIELSPIPFILTDPRRANNPIIAVNSAFATLTGYTSDEILGLNCRFLGGNDTEPEPRATLRHAIATATSVVVELTNYKRTGEAFRNAVMIAPFFDKEGKLAYFLGSQMEVTTGGLNSRKNTARQRVACLSSRQREILRLMSCGLRYSNIASELKIAEATVKMHRSVLVAKLGCQTTAEAIRIAVEADF